MISRATARLTNGLTEWAFVPTFRTFHAVLAAPWILLCGTLIILLFRPPDVQFYSIDRAALAALLAVTLLRLFVRRQTIAWRTRVTLPFAGLLMLGFWSALAQPYDAQVWSLYAAKWMVPFVLYHVAVQVFQNTEAVRQFEIFMLIALGYLIATAVLFLSGATSFIFPRYILDESLGIHIDRARGPFLNAVANGVTLNLLGLVALDSFGRRRLRGISALLLLTGLPVAILATKTRAVWMAFAGSLAALCLISPSLRVRRVCRCTILMSGLGILLVLNFEDVRASMMDRLHERGPVEFRRGMYQAGWSMFLDKPITGWDPNCVQSELSKRVSDFRPERFVFHNTYLEIAVEHGAVGLALYVWLFVDLFCLAKHLPGTEKAQGGNLLDGGFRALWPVLLTVYLVNASFVVMNYQFVNGLLFTIAGMLTAQNRKHSAVRALGNRQPCR